eukprot:10120536-Heterocapsa_arctica.AAC.1
MLAVCLGQGVKTLVPYGLDGGKTQRGPVGWVGPVEGAWSRDEPGLPDWSAPSEDSLREWRARGTPVFP